MVIDVNYARFTLADPKPRLCPDAVGSANVNGLPTRHRLSGPALRPHREVARRYWTFLMLPDAAGQSGAGRVQCNCLSKGVVINKTPSPYQPMRLYALRHSANVKGSRRNVGWFCPDSPPTTLEANQGIG